MGSKISSLFSSKKTKNQKRVEYSPRTAQERYDARRTGKLIYPPLSSIPKDEPKRSLRPDGRALYEPVYMDKDLDQSGRSYQNERCYGRSNFTNYYNQYDDGTFAVLSQRPTNGCHVFQL